MPLWPVTRTLRGRARRVCRDAERGFATLEAVIVIPVAVILTMLVIQYVLLWHARNIAEAAAQNGLRAARGYQATVAQGQASASDYLRTVAGHMLDHPRVTADRGATTVVLTVHATVISVIPFGSFSITETATGPVEKFAGG
jgi:type II secretory pathway pseudopilin PulG